MSKWILLLAIFGAAQPLPDQTLRVRHDHDPWGACFGELVVSASGIEFRSEKEEHSRQWAWIDIQSVERRSDRRFSILTWEDQRWKLGLDRNYDFSVAEGEPPLDERTFAGIVSQLKGPVLDRVPRHLKAEYSVAVKHLHLLGGCQGTLHFSRDWVVYETDYAPDARSWRRGRDLDSFWSADPFHLEIHAFEENQRAFDKARRFRFQLKEPLDRSYYQTLRREMAVPF